MCFTVVSAVLKKNVERNMMGIDDTQQRRNRRDLRPVLPLPYKLPGYAIPECFRESLQCQVFGRPDDFDGIRIETLHIVRCVFHCGYCVRL